MTAVCFRIDTVAPTAIASRLVALDNTLTTFWTRATFARIVCDVRSASFADRMAQIPNTRDWRRAHLEQHRRMYAHLEQNVFELDTTLALWPSATANLSVLEQTMAAAWQVPHIERVPFPQFVGGTYRNRGTYLEPEQRGAPFLAVLTAHDVRGVWAPLSLEVGEQGVAEGWHELLLLDQVRMTLAIDIQTLDPLVARRRIASVLKHALRGAQRASAESLDHAASSQALHLVRYAILIQAQRLDDLETATDRVAHTVDRRLPLERVHGAQDLHIGFFQDRPPAHIITPISARNTVSHGLACKTPLAVRRRVPRAGVLLGTDTEEGVPVHYELFGAQGRANANAVVVGTSGGGKSVFLMSLALRHALAGWQVFVMEPAYQAWKLRDAIDNDQACAYYEIANAPAINVLDPRSTNPHDQFETVVRKLETVLGTPKLDEGRMRMQPFELDDDARDALDRALMDERMYGHKGHKLAAYTQDTVPTLGTLVEILAEQPSAERLVKRIRARLLGSAAALYDRQTTLRFDRTKPVTIFSFRGVTQERLPLIYSHLFDEITRHVWSPARDRPTQPVLLIIDEYFFMKSVPLMEEEVIKATKTGRGRQFGVITADQNVSTYYGKHGDAGALITGNARQKFFFALDEEADVLGSVYRGQLAPAHLEQIKALVPGYCVAMLDRDVRMLHIELTPLERRALLQ